MGHANHGHFPRVVSGSWIGSFFHWWNSRKDSLIAPQSPPSETAAQHARAILNTNGSSFLLITPDFDGSLPVFNPKATSDAPAAKTAHMKTRPSVGGCIDSFFRRSLQMSHRSSRRDSCDSTRRDGCGGWLWRLVGLFFSHFLGR